MQANDTAPRQYPIVDDAAEQEKMEAARRTVRQRIASFQAQMAVARHIPEQMVDNGDESPASQAFRSCRSVLRRTK